MADVRVQTLKNGPYLVTGPIDLVDPDGKAFRVAGKTTIALCRCGGSTTKPFCDGTHSRAGFKAAETAIAAEVNK